MALKGILVRPATSGDMTAVGRLGALLVTQHHALDPQRFIAGGEAVAEGYAWFLDSQLEQPGVVILVAEREGRIVGYVYAALEPHNWKELRGPAGFVHDVVVEESARRLGVATGLVEAACAWLREHGAPRVMLWSAAPNAAAQALFERMGFRRTMVEMTRELGPGPSR